ncbi:ylmG homolog protein 1-2, chloroplastic-like [Phoenix dactylifera]|uniref:YlmG homolog protein 1-2, chloroplastic-like n=1 Tax=Phoenix dactylifera TaxID=42345 RepID=A0A8B9A2L8_PHODC|nr:ylmG homolog protein 1-2, chloroplastic-like [Phoenix dactylifera]XP_038978073.1 ylmG homolog protein 1-2, chloroplastic-like [Phoenix dactylifera]
MATVVSSTALSLRNPNPNSTLCFLHKPLPSSLSLLRLPHSNSLHLRLSRPSKSLVVSSSLASPPPPPPTLLPDSTRTLSSLLALALSVSKLVLSLPARIAAAATRGAVPSTVELAEIRDLRGSLACAVGPLFFAALKDRPSGYLNTPLTVVASGMAKWLDIYSGVLMVRVLLSWFPNIPWDRQPLSAIRDLCDPYLNLFRNIIPPVFDTLDVSPLLAFAVLGTLGSILNNSRGMY